MALKAGTLGGGNLVANQEQIGYACEAPAVAATISVSFCNMNNIPTKVRLAIGPGLNSSAAGTRFIECTTLEAGQPLDRGGIPLSAGMKVCLLYTSPSPRDS